MIIGVDIDDTLTDIRKELQKASFDYAKGLNKQINENSMSFDKNNDGSSFKEKYNFTHEELQYFFKNIQEKIIKSAEPREYVVECIKKLREDGNQIYIITARDYEFHDDPYGISKEWLGKNGIEYDKLVVNARSKAKACLEEKVDIFIDDKLSNCMDVSNAGILTIRITNYEDEHQNIVNKKNWKDIYEYIKQIKVN